MSFLLDTCVLSEYTKRTPEAKVLAWVDAQTESGLFISQLSIAELERGVRKLSERDAARAARLNAWLDTVRARFAPRTLAVDAAVWRVWAQLCAAADTSGQPIAPLDAILMATAHCHGLTIVTRNAADFARYPQVINPWAL